MATNGTSLLLHNREVRTVFDLLGKDENDITFSIGWGLSQSPAFRQRLLKSAFGTDINAQQCEIRLQDHGDDGGYTDVELGTPDVHLIIEAKRGWTLPSRTQLQKYTRRFDRRVGKQAMVVMSSCTAAYAEGIGAVRRTGGIPVHYMCWEQVHQLGTKCCGVGTLQGKLFMRQLCSYLEDIMELQDQESNLVYVLALSNDTWNVASASWVDFVNEHRRYFHPYGKGWPTTPPNYLGFRYNGRLQSIHHVEQCECVTDLGMKCPGFIKSKWKRSARSRRSRQYLLYRLGPPICPTQEVRTHNVRTKRRIFMNARVWAALDLLLTRKTIAEARDRTQKRLQQLAETPGGGKV
jgi:hypothetical protein